MKVVQVELRHGEPNYKSFRRVRSKMLQFQAKQS